MNQKKSPVEYLSDYCAQLIENSKILNENSSSTVSPIAEILDMAIVYIHEIIKNNGGDPNHNVIEDADVFDAQLERRIKFFQMITNKKLDDMSKQIQSLQKSLVRKEGTLDSLIERLQMKQKILLQQKDHENQLKRQEVERNFETEKQSLKNEQQQQYDNFEFELSTILNQLKKEWDLKLKSLDNKIQDTQKNLQVSVHDKHQSSNKLQQAMVHEEKRVAFEHERISREFQERKNKAEQNLIKYQAQFDSLTKSLKNTNETATSKMENLERAVLQERAKIEEDHQNQLNKLTEEIDEQNQILEQRKLEFQSEEMQSKVKITETQKELNAKLNEELKYYDQKLSDGLEELDYHYKSIIEDLMRKVNDHENQRNIILEGWRKRQLEASEKGEKGIAELVSHQMEEKKRMNVVLKREQEELENIKQQKHLDLKELKHKMQTQYADALSTFEQEERQHSDEITSLMKKFEMQQKQLMTLQKQYLESRDQKKVDELHKLQQAHEHRKREILFNIEKQMEIDAAKAINESVSQENQKHSDEVSSLKEKILDMKGRMDLLQMKIAGLHKINNSKLTQLMQENDKKLVEDIKKFAEEKEKGKELKDQSQQIQKRLKDEAEEVDRRKNLVLAEANNVGESIQKLQEDFEARLARVEGQYASSIVEINKKNRNIQTKKQYIEVQVDQQNADIQKFSDIAASKEEEADDFEKKFEDKKNEFKEQKKSEYESTLNNEKLKPLEFQNEMNEIRETLTQKIEDFQQQIQLAKDNAEKTTQLMLMERKQALEEAEMTLKGFHDEKIKELETIYNDKIQKIEKDFNDAEKSHESIMQQIKSVHDAELEQKKVTFNNLWDELSGEKQKLDDQKAELLSTIKELENRECPDCVIKKDLLKKMLKKREDLYTQMQNVQHDINESEKKMKKIFPPNQTKPKNNVILQNRKNATKAPTIYAPTLNPVKLL